MHSNRLYPSWEQINQLRTPLTAGELSLVQYLDLYLPKDKDWTQTNRIEDYKHLKTYNGWLIFVQPFLNGARPDIIIFHPKVGLMIYEVKDWDLKHYGVDKGSLTVNTRDGSYDVKHPKNQVEHYKDNIQNQLVPAIGEAVDLNKKNFGLIKTGIYCNNSSTSECRDVLGTPVKPENFKYFPFIGRDALTVEKLQEVVPDAYRTFSFWKEEWNEELLFWLLPPFHSIEQGTVLTLRGNQSKIAEPQPGHHRIRGVAGSGKTQALAYRAGKLASMSKHVLIVTFNITLWHYIRDMIQRTPFKFRWDQFTFAHFHGFCKDRLNEFGVKWPQGPNRDNYDNDESFEKALEFFFRITIPDKVKSAIRGQTVDCYDAILIDEGQDYYYQWYELLMGFFLTSRDELVVVCDKKQNIYERELDWLDKRVTRIGLDRFKDPYIDLTTSYRLPNRIAEISNRFSEIFGLNQEVKLSRIERTNSLHEHIVWRNVERGQWLNDIFNSYRRLTYSGEHPSDIVILLPTHKIGLQVVHFFKEKKIGVNHVFEDDQELKTNKKIFWMGDSRLKMCTIHSFKGWELLNIVLYIPFITKDSFSRMDSIVYTAITRTKANLIIINENPRYEEFGDTLPKKWDDQ